MGEVPPYRFALIDLARAPGAMTAVEELVGRGAAQCLFEGRLEPALRRVAPYIVALDRAPALWSRWMAEGRGDHWGIFLDTAAGMAQARRHVRRFVQVRLADGSGPVLFRLWDPRVMSVVLRHGDAGERGAILRDDMVIALEVEGRPDLMERHDAAGWAYVAATQALAC